MAAIPQDSAHDTAPLLALQALRAVAALLVVVHHAGYDADTLARRAGLPPLALDRIFDWTFGVHLFFVISGYLMLRTARGFGSLQGAATFAIRRLVRVVPLYWLLTTLVILGASVAPDLLNVPIGGAAVVLGSYLFVPVLRTDGAINPVLGQGWTLDYEMAFYALFALALLLPRRVGLVALSATLILLAAAGRLLRPGGALAAVWTGELLLEFLFGLAVGLLQERGARLPALAAAGCFGIGTAAAIALGPILAIASGVSPVLRAGVPAAVVVAGAVLGPRWGWSLGTVALAALGDASYSLYLSHPFVVRLLRVAWSTLAPDDVPLAVYVVLACGAAVAVSLLLYRWLERPMTLALQRLVSAGRRPILADAARRRG